MEKEQEKLIVNLLRNNTQKEIAKIFNVSQTTIYKIKNKYQIETTKRGCKNYIKKSVDEMFFDDINTPNKAYWLGYLAADGCITKTHQKTSLSSKDLEIIEKFKNDTKSEHMLSTIEFFDKRTNKIYHRFSIQITNVNFTEKLCKWGVNENKSHTFLFPNIKEKYYSYFIAGLFDGDGSIYTSSNNTLKCNLIATKETLSFIQNYFLEKLYIQPKALIKVSKNSENAYKVYWLTYDALKILDFIYNGDKDLYLSRKYALYEQYKSNRPSRHRINIIQEFDYNGKILNTYYGLNSAAKHIGIHETTLFRWFKKNNGEFKKNGHIWKKEK